MRLLLTTTLAVLVLTAQPSLRDPEWLTKKSRQQRPKPPKEARFVSELDSG